MSFNIDKDSVIKRRKGQNWSPLEDCGNHDVYGYRAYNDFWIMSPKSTLKYNEKIVTYKNYKYSRINHYNSTELNRDIRLRKEYYCMFNASGDTFYYKFSGLINSDSFIMDDININILYNGRKGVYSSPYSSGSDYIDGDPYDYLNLYDEYDTVYNYEKIEELTSMILKEVKIISGTYKDEFFYIIECNIDNDSLDNCLKYKYKIIIENDLSNPVYIKR